MKTLIGVLIGVALAALAFFGGRQFGSQTQTQVIESEPMQIYAGDPVPVVAPDRSKMPSLYSCRDSSRQEGVFMLISPVTGEFMLFDLTGVWINNGQFFDAKTDQNVQYLHAEVGNVLLAFFLDNANRWHLAISTEEGVTELGCN